VPIVMVTAKDSRVDVVGGLDAGADDYITKPFEMDEVVARVRAVLKRNRPPQEASQALFRSGGLFIDFTSGRVAMGNVDVQLPPTEYRILCLLAGNAGRVVTYRELLAEVWKGEYGVDTHVMHVAVARLRKKLGDEPGKGNLISNRSGFGYVLKIHTREHGMVACNSSQPEGTAVVSTSAPHVVDTAWNAPVIPGVSEMPRPPVSIGCPPT